MPGPYTIQNIVDIAANTSTSLFVGLQGVTLVSPSRVVIYASREAIDVLMSVTVGGTNAGQALLAQINTTVGSSPVVPDNKIVDTFGMGGDEIIILGQNLTAGALELRALCFVTPVDDVALRCC